MIKAPKPNNFNRIAETIATKIFVKKTFKIEASPPNNFTEKYNGSEETIIESKTIIIIVNVISIISLLFPD